MLIREFIDVVISNLKSNSLDDYISGEYIYNVSVPFTSLLLKREAQSRKLYKNNAAFTKLDCVEMVDADINECKDCIPTFKIKRSKKKLPKTILSNYGSMIQVFNIKRDVNYIESTPLKISNLQYQKYKPKNTKYFYLENDYLYIPDSEVEVVIVLGLFSDLDKISEFTQDGKCSSVLDLTYPIPDYLLSSVIEATTNQVLMNKKINQDEDTNLNNLDKT